MSDKPEKPIYIRNAKGGVHSVTEAHHKALLEADGTLPKNWKQLSEAEARKAAPELFGLDADGQPVKTDQAKPFSPNELVDALRQAFPATTPSK